MTAYCSGTFGCGRNANPGSTLNSTPSRPQIAPTIRWILFPPPLAEPRLCWFSREAITLILPCRQCSRSLPEGSSMKRAKPECEDFLMPISWFSRCRNSSTVEEPSKPTTCGERSLVHRASGGRVRVRVRSQSLSSSSGFDRPASTASNK